MRTAILVLLSAVLFLLAAKAHGRELRLEREAAGFHQIAFGAPDNPPFVETLWHQERVRFWSVTVLLALVAGGRLLAKGAPGGLSALVVLTWVPAVSFLGLGLYSLLRRGVGGGEVLGSLGWWSLVLMAFVGTVLIAWGAGSPMLAARPTLE
jgi:hypothetical protein